MGEEPLFQQMGGSAIVIFKRMDFGKYQVQQRDKDKYLCNSILRSA